MTHLKENLILQICNVILCKTYCDEMFVMKRFGKKVGNSL
jgi:hypothetical protein